MVHRTLLLVLLTAPNAAASASLLGLEEGSGIELLTALSVDNECLLAGGVGVGGTCSLSARQLRLRQVLPDQVNSEEHTREKNSISVRQGGPYYTLCSGTRYNVETHGCCAGNIFEFQHYGCCGETEVYRTGHEACCFHSGAARGWIYRPGKQQCCDSPPGSWALVTDFDKSKLSLSSPEHWRPR
mmetsp:Transcript_4705/g.12954  ORF Transcript_4705/g.12954 Transcript_4705/m.12954 type:complete len:185 (-) Transcript_4705:95-649(-)